MKLKEEMENIENNIKNLDIIKQNINYQIDKLKKSDEWEIKFMKILLLILKKLKEFELLYYSKF